MRMLSIVLVGGLILPLLPACGTGAGGPGNTIESGKGGSGTEQCDPDVYPCGPYGYQAGSTMENLSFVGQRDANGDNVIDASDPVINIKLSDYFAQKNIYALAISATAVWCEPCNEEQPDVESMYKAYKANGDHVAFLEASIQKEDGTPSDMPTVRDWRDKYGISFDLVADPTGVLGPYYDIDAFPMNMVVRTRDMKIVWEGNGLAPDVVKSNIDQVLANP